MKLIGQFNRGFILGVINDQQILILDQHACDEKINFEGLSQNTVVRS